MYELKISGHSIDFSKRSDGFEARLTYPSGEILKFFIDNEYKYVLDGLSQNIDPDFIKESSEQIYAFLKEKFPDQ